MPDVTTSSPVYLDGTDEIEHSQMERDQLHEIGYIQANDPGAVGARKTWIDTSLGMGNWVGKIRNQENTGWEVMRGDESSFIPSFSGARYYLTSDFTLGTGTGWQDIQNGSDSYTEVYDTDESDPDVYYKWYSSFKVPEDGYYEFSFIFTFDVKTEGAQLEIGFFEENTARVVLTEHPIANDAMISFVGTTKIYAQASKYYKFSALHGTSGPQPVIKAGETKSCVCVKRLQDGAVLGPFKGAAVHLNTGYNIADQTWTSVDFDDEEYDEGGFWASGNKNRFTAPEDGYYNFSAIIKWDQWGGGSDRKVRVRKNGSTDLTIVEQRAAGTDSDTTYLSQVIDQDYKLNKDDYIEVDVWHNRGSGLHIRGTGDGYDSEMSIHKIGEL